MTIVQCCYCKKRHDVWYECDEVDAMTIGTNSCACHPAGSDGPRCPDAAGQPACGPIKVYGQPVHYLKCTPEFFDPLNAGEKNFEVRLNDRGFRVGDLCVFRRWTSDEGYTGLAAVRTVTFILDDPRYCLPGYVVLGLRGKK
jgi:hypothetical protein